MNKRPYIIVVGNEKGGTGKSTISMHLIVGLLKVGLSVGVIDVDSRQGSLTRYLQNREKKVNSIPTIKMPMYFSFKRSENSDKNLAENEDKSTIDSLIGSLVNNDVILFDTPGSDMFASQVAHSYADTLISPINDSFVDMDLLVKIDSNKRMRPSVYSEMVWNQKKNKMIRDGNSIDWIVIRNRLSTIASKNKIEIDNILKELSRRLGFRVGDGFCERVIFREMFLDGLTVLDIDDKKLSISHLAAKQELRSLIQMIKFPEHILEKIMSL